MGLDTFAAHTPDDIELTADFAQRKIFRRLERLRSPWFGGFSPVMAAKEVSGGRCMKKWFEESPASA